MEILQPPIKDAFDSESTQGFECPDIQIPFQKNVFDVLASELNLAPVGTGNEPPGTPEPLPQRSFERDETKLKDDNTKPDVSVID